MDKDKRAGVPHMGADEPNLVIASAWSGRCVGETLQIINPSFTITYLARRVTFLPSGKREILIKLSTTACTRIKRNPFPAPAWLFLHKIPSVSGP